VLIPFIIVAQSKLQQVLGGSAYTLLNEKSHLALARMLLERLSKLAAPSLFMHFAWFKKCSGYDSPFSFLNKTKSNSPENECYQAFIKDMFEGGLVSFLKEYPVVARLAASQTEQWIDTVSEFVKRLASDRDEISTKFGLGKNIGQVIQVSPGLSDEHDHGHTVYGLTFASGLRLIYKPKDIGIETAYNSFLNWLNNHHASFSFKTIKTLDRSGYGWVEFVEHLPCNSAEGLKTYYHRAGHLLAVVYALRGTDCHYENIIASGEYPVLVDAEMLLYPCLRGLAGLKAGQQEDIYEKFILNTGLLPQGDLVKGNKIIDGSGLAGCCDQEKYRVPVWKNVNTDEMSYEHDYQTGMENQNMPYLEHGPIPPRDYVEQIINGFAEVYNFIMQNREAILSQDGPLAFMQDKKLRFILRSTWVYYTMLTKTLEPKYMHNSADRSIEIDRFAYSMLNADSIYWPLLQAEEKALEQLDIPYFSLKADQNDIQVSEDEIIKNILPETGYELVKKHIRA
jgi:type 2 lantibiotic biosynthesis protein LanM